MYRIFLIFISLLLINSACRKLVQDEFADFENKITVNSIFVEDENAEIHLSFTNKLNEHELNTINSAIIEVYNQDSVLLNFQNISNGKYVSDYIIKENDSFNLKIIVDKDSVIANCHIPAKTEILDFQVNENAWVGNEGDTQPEIHFTISTDKTKNQYFEADIIIYYQESDYIEESYAIAYFDNINHDIDSLSKSVKIQHSHYSYPPKKYKYQLMIKSVDFNYYNYAKSFVDYELSRYPDFSNLGVVPENLFSNIENGYGIFCGYAKSFSLIKQPN